MTFSKSNHSNDEDKRKKKCPMMPVCEAGHERFLRTTNSNDDNNNGSSKYDTISVDNGR